MGEKSCENCFNAWLIEQVQKKLWSPPRDARAAIQCCSRCSRFPLPLEDCWTAIPEVDVPCDAVHDMTHSGEVEKP